MIVGFCVGDRVIHTKTLQFGTVKATYLNGTVAVLFDGNLLTTDVPSSYLNPVTARAPAPQSGEPLCTSCGKRNEYQPGPYTCHECKLNAQIAAEIRGEAEAPTQRERLSGGDLAALDAVGSVVRAVSAGPKVGWKAFNRHGVEYTITAVNADGTLDVTFWRARRRYRGVAADAFVRFEAP